MRRGQLIDDIIAKTSRKFPGRKQFKDEREEAHRKGTVFLEAKRNEYLQV